MAERSDLGRRGVTPARERRWSAAEIRVLRVDPASGVLRDGCAADLARWLRAGDLLVLNDAATVPASLAGLAPGDAPLELRLAAEREPGTWSAVLFGAGDWRTRTEERPPPPQVEPGDRLQLGALLSARVLAVSERSPRLVELRFDPGGDAFWDALLRTGRPVQYSHLVRELEPWDVQTAYATRPWAVEAPSAGLPFTNGLLLELRRRGVGLASITHAAGLSSTGDAALDAALPLPERSEVGAEAAAAIARARAAGGRVVAAGTSVVRALESAAGPRGIEPGTRVTQLRLGPGSAPRVVDGLLTGFHEPGTSHLELLRAFLAPLTLAAITAHAERRGYLGHEFGDALLVLPRRGAARAVA